MWQTVIAANSAFGEQLSISLAVAAKKKEAVKAQKIRATAPKVFPLSTGEPGSRGSETI
jgi:hypothetical protein